MSKITQQKIKDGSEEVKETARQLDQAHALDALSNMEGGQVLIASFTKDAINIIDALSIKYKNLTRDEFVGYCADLKNKLDVVRALKRAKKNKKFLTEALEDALQE